MAGFTETETEIIKKYIRDEELHTSLRLIRESVEKLWVDTPRIIKNYTDHGIKHCERLVCRSHELLEANDGKDLTEYEMYLLLAGIYLHDIGMQCDVVNFPKIKEQAEELGAEFKIDFTSNIASDYKIEEQSSIRINHPYLSAAWISYAHDTGNTVLGPALKTVPFKLISDLMDICKFHSSTLPITSCGSNLTLYPEMRKKLIAALLRFADELDIDSKRVSIETVKNFSFDPHNSLYWWFHNLTTVSFISKNVVLLKVVLHPEDMRNYESLIKQVYIESFKTKNQIILDALAREGIPIRIDSDSKVEEYKFAGKLPIAITEILEELQKTNDPLSDLCEEVKMWLQIIKYEVTECTRFDDRIIDVKAVNPFKQNLLIRCIGGEISKIDVESLDRLLDRKIPQGWLISDRRVSQNARLRASEDSALEVFTLKEFLRQKVWGQYFDKLKSMVEKEQIPDLYVDIGCYKERIENERTLKEEYTSLDNYINDWLTERGKTHISLLGEFGTGKTWFCKHYAYFQLKRYLEDPVKQRLPLLITLRDFIKATTVHQLINDALLEQYKLPFVGSAFDSFKEMNRRGKLLLILDGFDEMARQVDYQTVVDNFWELAKLVEENSKVILTSRNEYFRWAEESEKIFGGKEFGRRTIILAPPKFEVLYLKQLTDSQIHEIIVKKKGSEEGNLIADNVLNKENLATMARKPVLIELLLASLDEVDDTILENPAQIYLYATNKLLLRNIKTERTFTTTADKLFFLYELAWEMIKSNEMKIHYSEIPERISSYFKSKIKDKHELDTWDFDLRNQTLLHRNAAGYYEFSHKSLAEYFVAFKFASELRILSPLYKKTYCEASGKYCKIPVKSRKIVELIDTFGYFPLKSEQTKTICDLLSEMISDKDNKKLWQIIEFTRNKSFDDVKYLGGNAATLLSKNKGTFSGANLKNTVLVGADIAGSDLLSTILDGCNLKNAIFLGCKFNEKILNAKLDENTVFLRFKSFRKYPTIEILNLEQQDDFSKIYDLLGKDSYKIFVDELASYSKDLDYEFQNRNLGSIYMIGWRIEKIEGIIAYIWLNNCDIPQLVKHREAISEKLSGEIEIYFNEINFPPLGSEFILNDIWDREITNKYFSYGGVLVIQYKLG